MKFVACVLTYQRMDVLSKCLDSLFNNTNIEYDEIWIIDDGSSIEIQKSLFQFAVENNNYPAPIRLVLSGRNRGCSFSFENAYGLMRMDDREDVVYCFIESDYIWRKGYLEDIQNVFESSPYTVAVAGTDHEDMYSSKINTTFTDLMIDQFDEDLKARNLLYKEFLISNIRVFGVSNSCGCQFIHWGRLKKILKDGDERGKIYNTKNYWHWMDRAFHKWGTTQGRRYASDAHMSGTISFFGEKWLEDNNIELDGNFPIINICDYSISIHLCGGPTSLNGHIVPEGVTFLKNPHWSDSYLTENPRKNII